MKARLTGAAIALAMNGRHDGLEHVLALMRLRGVEPDFKARSVAYGSRSERWLARLRRAAVRAE